MGDQSWQVRAKAANALGRIYAAPAHPGARRGAVARDQQPAQGSRGRARRDRRSGGARVSGARGRRPGPGRAQAGALGHRPLPSHGLSLKILPRRMPGADFFAASEEVFSPARRGRGKNRRGVNNLEFGLELAQLMLLLLRRRCGRHANRTTRDAVSTGLRRACAAGGAARPGGFPGTRCPGSPAGREPRPGGWAAALAPVAHAA